MSNCILCNNDSFTQIETEIICAKCGVIADYDQTQNPTIQKSDISAHEEQQVGSRKLIVDGLNLPHLNKKRTERIIINPDKHLDSLSKVCNIIRLPKHVSRDALYLFQKLKPAKLGSGKTAVFCIHHACLVSGVIYDEDHLVVTVRSQFNLKRPLCLAKALYKIKQAVSDGKLVETLDDDHEKYFLRKNISPNNVRDAVKLRGVFEGSSTGQKLRRTESYLNAYN